MSDGGEAADSGPAGEEPAERRFDYDRTVALSDGVFAIALTLLVLNIEAPALSSGHEGVLGSRLLDHGDEFFSYALGFAVIGLLWVRHHSFFRGVERIDTRLTVLNLVYLGLVAFMPYPTRILGLYGRQPAAVIMYGATAATVSVVARALSIHAVRAGLLSEAGAREAARRGAWVVVPTVFVISIPIALVSPTAALYSWLLIFVLPRLRRLLPTSG
ncbi:MAG TPA: TMEM175 family protein [Acidimicrobiales bacterium]|nr:TMEM175 family protein [Acidimicrobiales bacterium]